MMRILIGFIGLIVAMIVGFEGIAQEYNTKTFTAKKINTFYPKKAQSKYQATIQPVYEAPYPSGKSYQEHLMKLKTNYAKNHPAKYYAPNYSGSRADAPEVIEDFGTYFFPPNQPPMLHDGGTPNDNSMAFSNDGMLITSWNSQIYAHDVKADTHVFKNHPVLTTLSFQAFAGNLTTDRPFDPKILYDVNEDKFVLLFLSGRDTGTSKTIIGFSTTNNPADPWNVYEIDGNPLKNNTWTDYPALALTNNELFYTVNLLRAGESWIAGFSETLIWQIDKHSGYKGDAELDLKLWSDIKFEGKPLRYFRPIQNGAAPAGPNMYFISNRGIPVEWNDSAIVKNDTIFLLEVTAEKDNNPQLRVTAIKANDTYQTPTNATQDNGHILFTNDARVLGGFLNNNEIQFVGNTLDKATNRPAIYHGIIQNVNSSPSVTLKTIGHGSLDYGFPNIAYTGIKTDNQSSVIGFNHTSATDFAGFSCIYYDGKGGYSALKMIKEGENYVDGISWSNGDRTYERWGDYFGIQRNYRAPKQVWLNGYFGQSDRIAGSWVAHVKAPFDTTDPDEGIDTSYFPLSLKEYETTAQASVFPNPNRGTFTLSFEIEKAQNVRVELNPIDGRQAIKLIKGPVYAGKNELSFNTFTLAKGVYTLNIFGEHGLLNNQRVVIQ